MDIISTKEVEIMSSIPEVLLHILQFADPKTVARFCCANSHFNNVGSDHTLWEKFCNIGFPLVRVFRPIEYTPKRHYAELYHNMTHVKSIKDIEFVISKLRMDLIILHYTSQSEHAPEIPLMVMKHAIIQDNSNILEWAIFEGYEPGDEMLFELVKYERIECAKILMKHRMSTDDLLYDAIFMGWGDFLFQDTVKQFLNIDHLNMAIEFDNSVMVEYLNHLGIHMNQQAVSNALTNGDNIALQYGLERSIVPTNVSLIDASGHGNIDGIKLSKKYHVNIPDLCLSTAIMEDQLEIVQYLAQDMYLMRTHLTVAASWNSIDTLRWLIEVVGMEGSSEATDMAFVMGSDITAKYLISIGVLPWYDGLNNMTEEMMVMMVGMGLYYTSEQLDQMWNNLRPTTLKRLEYAGLI